MSSPDQPHISVLLNEVVEALAPEDGGIYVDGTFGAGGYSKAILAAADCTVYGIDRDPDAYANGKALEAEFGGRLKVLKGCFGDMEALLAAEGIAAVDGVTLDLGVSSMQLDQAERGFSFRFDGPLDMRMAQDGPSAADLVNELPEGELADIIYKYGEERHSRRVARAIVLRRAERLFERTLDLAAVVEKAVPGAHKSKVHPATRTFQGLRIAVNDELGEEERGLLAAEKLLKPEGRLAVVSFHSLEDRLVKQFLAPRAGRAPKASRYLPPTEQDEKAPSFSLLWNGAKKPTDDEISVNPRSRSSRLRAAVRTDAPIWEKG